MVKVPYFNEMEIPLSADYDTTEPGVAAALEAFLSLTSADRLKNTRHVFAYYQDVRDVVGEEWLDEEMGVPKTQIYRFVATGRRVFHLDVRSNRGVVGRLYEDGVTFPAVVALRHLRSRLWKQFSNASISAHEPTPTM